MLAARNVTVMRGPRLVLDQVDLSVDAGSRIGVLGRNGAGKSTLLRVLAGLEAATSGAVERAPAALTVGYLTQEVDPLDGETTAAYLRRRTGLARAEAALEQALAALERSAGPAELAAHPTRIAEIDMVSHRLDEFGGGFTAYMEERRLRREQAYARFESAREERTRLEASARQRKEWSVSRRGQKKTDKDKALAARQKERSESAAAGAKALEGRIERLAGVEKPWEGWELRMSLRTLSRSGEVVATLGGAMVE